MADIAISVSKLGKWFDTTRRSNGLREAIVSSLQRTRGQKKVQGFWALRDIDLTVNKGEIVGLIGHNGAGKSVLLKILSGITNPTEGRAEIRGRIGALLELGTGFHPELSGRDNIYLNGSLLGMLPWEIEEKFEEIVEFSGIRYAIDESVKHYSSGMMMRLAFSVAANLAPEVIFLDEVWAVGDIDFQKRAFTKMRQLISSGRTVIIVSHSLDTIANVCSTCVLLDHGRVKDIGNARKVVQSYISSFLKAPPAAQNSTMAPEGPRGAESNLGSGGQSSPPGIWYWGDTDTAPGSERIRLRTVKLLNSQEEVTDDFVVGQPITLEVTYKQSQPDDLFIFGVVIQNHLGTAILANQSSPQIRKGSTGRPAMLLRRARCVLPGRLPGGSYKIVLAVGRNQLLVNSPDFVLQDVLSFGVSPGKGEAQYPVDVSMAGLIDAKWTVELLAADTPQKSCNVSQQ